MEQEKKKGKKKGLVILILLLLVLAATSATLLLVDPQKLNIFQNETAIENLSDAEQTLRERLAAEGRDTIEVNESIEIYGGPLIVNGDKELIGSGELIAMEGIKEDGLLSVSDGASLKIEDIKLSGNLMVDYILYIAKSGEAIIGDSVDISEAADINVYNMGSLTMAGGRLRKGNVGIRNSGTAVIEDGIIALMNKYLVDNREEGTLEIKGGTFSSSEGYGVYNRGEMTVSDAEISANKLMGICNLGKAEVKDSLISQNGYHNIINKSRGKLILENSDITGSSQSGIHNEEDAYAVIKECKFNTNKLGNLHNRGEAEVYKCAFEDVAYSSILSDGKVASTYIEDTSIINTTSTGHGLLSTNGCKAELKNVTFTNIEGRAIHNKGGHVKGENIKVDQTGKVAIGNDKYETGAFGTISLKKVDVLTPFVAIINNCDGTFELQDAKLRSTENTVVRIAAGTMTLEDVAVTGAPAKGDTKFYGVYANGGTLNIKDCSIKNTSSRGIQNQKTKMNIDGLSITNTGAAAMGTVAAKPGETPSTIIANNLTITGAGSNSICNAGDTSKIVVTNSVINPAGGNSIRVLEGVLTMENTKIYGSQKEECVAVKVEKKGTATLKKNTYITNEMGRGVINEGTLHMQDVKIENCKTVSHGGAIYNNANLKVTDCILYNNISGANGGAIHSTAVSKMELSNVELSNNTATGQGGAINLPASSEEKPGSTIQLSNVIIKNNKVENYSSGAIYVGKYRQLKVDGAKTEISRNSAVTYGGAIGMGDYASVTFADGTIHNNASEGGGGAIFLKPSAKLTMTNAKIRENEAKEHGGAIYVSAKAKLTATGTTLAGNIASKKGETYKNGGAIHAEAASLVDLSNVKLNNNIATGQGGAINLPSGAEDIKDSPIKLTNVTIKGNEAENYSSGAIYVGRYRQLEIDGDGTLINGNTSGTYGGAIGAGDYSQVTINAGTISENKTSNNNGGGGVFVKPNAVLTMNGGNISQNTASAGGGIYLDETAAFVMTGGKVNSNTAENGNGGGIFSSATASLKISNAELSGNTASVQGGAINLNKAASKEAATKLTLTNVTMKDNKALTKSSGAVFVGAYREIEINGEKTLISGNNAKTTGGAIGTADNAVVTMSAGTISENEANAADGGGAIFLWNATFNMTDGTINGNVAKAGNGGAIVGAGTLSSITVTGGEISNNEAGNGSGGAIHAVEATEVNLSNVELNGNKASVQGGAISLAAGTNANAKKLTITDVTIKDNATSTKSSGAIFVGKYRQLEINGADTLISGNNAKTTGGAIGTADYASITMNAGTISGNEANAADGGGAIFLWNATFNMTDGTINGNVAKAGNGGAIVGAGTLSSITVTGGEISNNEAGNGSGGAIHAVEATEVNLSNVELNGNKASVQGGAISLAAGSKATTKVPTLTDVTIKDNITSTKSSGAIYVGKYRNLEINGENTLISGNDAKTTGGAIGTADYATVTINAGTISGNTANAKDGGGAIFLWNATLHLNGGTINGNVAKAGNGGAIVGASASEITMNGGTITGNTANATGGGGIYLRETAVFTMNGGSISANNVKSGLNGENVYINSGTTVKLGENANLASVYFATGNTPIQVMGNALNNPVTVTCTSANQAGILVVKKAEGATVDLRQLCDSGKIVVGAGFDNKDYALIETEQGMAWTAVAKVATFAELKSAIESTNNALQYIKVETPLSVNETANVKNNANIILIGNATLTRASGFTGEFFSVAAGSTLTLEGTTKDNKLILDGAKSTVAAAKPLISNSGTLNINEGVVLQNNNNNSASGGAISTTTSMNVENAEFIGNTAKVYGGAIFLDNGSAAAPGKVTLTNVTIQGNTASTKAGGAIYVAKYRQLEINGNNTVISGNTTGATGGAIGTNTGAVVTMNAGTLSNNTASGYDGGAVYLWQATFVMNGGIVSGNKTGVADKKGCGGAIFVSTGSGLSLSNGEISGNTANYRGGAIYIDSEASLDELMKFTNVTIKNNKTTTNSAGAVYVGKYRNIEIAGANTLISGNVAKTNGGAFVTSEGVNLVMKAGTISGNTANGGDGAGGVYCWGPSTFAMSGGTVKDNVDNSGKASPNVRAYYKVTVQLSGDANLASISWQPDNGKTNTNAIQVTGPLTATDAVTEVTFAGYSEGTKVASYTGEGEADMTALLSKFRVKDANYKLVTDGKDIKLANQ